MFTVKDTVYFTSQTCWVFQDTTFHMTRNMDQSTSINTATHLSHEFVFMFVCLLRNHFILRNQSLFRQFVPMQLIPRNWNIIRLS